MAQATRTNWRNLVTVASIMILIGTEVFGIAIAAGWAIAGLFELGDIVSYILMGLFTLFGVYIMTMLWRSCISVEPISESA